ncbi:hypothetical protein [Methanosarcina sp.]|uniref:hypothetical protein n=1 Tax=Methanosarcina sp. TaxID=2213 RepID=UPI002BFAB0DA|nr:hypothetical protein [Methanosarcina sp.]HOW14201.1 hypothetical protein [Methanosarcina sp.]
MLRDPYRNRRAYEHDRDSLAEAHSNPEKMEKLAIAVHEIADLEAARYPYCAADFKDFDFVLDACWGEDMTQFHNLVISHFFLP